MKKYTTFIFQPILILSLFTLTHSLTAQEWNPKADMINPRLFFSVSAVGNHEIYVIGGTLAAPMDSVEAYVPETDTWEKRASLISPRAGVVTCQVGGKIYAMGGWDAQNPALGTLEVYDPKTDKWTEKTDMPTPRTALAVRALNTKIYAIGGTSVVQGPGLATVERYNPSADTWEKTIQMPTARVFLGAASLNNKIYTVGGVVEGIGPKILPTLEVFNLGTRNVTARDKQLMPWGNIKSGHDNFREIGDRSQ